MMGVLRAERVTVPRGRGGLREPVSFSVASGQALLVRGGNGSGKTTLLKALAGIVKHSGILQYYLNESGAQELGKPCSLEERREACGVSLEPLFFPDTTVRHVLEDQCWLYGINSDAVADIAKRLDIVHLLEQGTDVLSTGERTRLSVARALITSPRILILDEPERGLDPQGFATISAAVREFLASGGIAVIATHRADWPFDTPVIVDCGKGEGE